jgi:hypothetical protein
MNGERVLSMLETGATALLVTLALVAAYVILKRMARQMRKGVDLATRQAIDAVTMNWLDDGRLHIHIELPQGMAGRLVLSFESKESQVGSPVHEANDASTSIDLAVDVPDEARALVVEASAEKLFRPLPSRS